MITKLTESIDQKIGNLVSDVNTLKSKSTHLGALEATIEELRKDKANLLQENAELREKNLNCSLITSDLNTKVKDLEYERESLLMAIKLQQQGFEKSLNKQTQNRQPISVSERQCEDNNGQQTSSFISQNRFSVLDDQGGTVGNGPQTVISEQNLNLNDDMQISPNIQISPPINEESLPSEQHPIVIIGDSIIKHINPQKLSSKTVKKYTFPGKTADEISNQIESMKTGIHPSHVIIHAGTNDIPVQNSNECTTNIEKLAGKAKSQFPNAKIGLSGITLRQDVDVNDKINQTNENIRNLCTEQGYTFIDNGNIDPSGLNNSKLHLNAKGTAYLAVNFIKFIRHKKPNGFSNSRRQSEIFHKSQLLQMGNLLTSLAIQPVRPRV